MSALDCSSCRSVGPSSCRSRHGAAAAKVESDSRRTRVLGVTRTRPPSGKMRARYLHFRRAPNAARTRLLPAHEANEPSGERLSYASCWQVVQRARRRGFPPAREMSRKRPDRHPGSGAGPRNGCLQCSLLRPICTHCRCRGGCGLSHEPGLCDGEWAGGHNPGCKQCQTGSRRKRQERAMIGVVTAMAQAAASLNALPTNAAAASSACGVAPADPAAEPECDTHGLLRASADGASLRSDNPQHSESGSERRAEQTN